MGKDERFMRRGEARELPDYLYQSWQERNKPSKIIEEKMANRTQFSATAILAAAQQERESDSDADGPLVKKLKQGKKKKKKDKAKENKKNKKCQKDKKKKKAKKEKGKKKSSGA